MFTLQNTLMTNSTLVKDPRSTRSNEETFSANSEAFSLEILGDFEKMFPRYRLYMYILYMLYYSIV